MQPNAAEIKEAIQQIKRATGLTVEYVPNLSGGGHGWYTVTRRGGQWSRVQVGRENHIAFDDVLQQTMLNMRAARNNRAATTSGPAAAAPAPVASSSPSRPTPSFWQRAAGGMGGIGGGVAATSAMGAVRAVTGVAAGPAGMALSAGSIALSAVTGIVGGVIRSIIGVVSGGFRLLMGLVQGIIGAGLNLARTALTTAVVGITAVFGILTTTIFKARDALTSMARSIDALRGSTGMSAGRAGGLINRFNAFGIGPEQTAAMFENSNPLMLAMRARMLGASSFDAPGAIPAMAQRFQGLSQTPFGNRLARNFLGDMDTPEMRRVLMTPVPILKQQEAYQNQVQRTLGVDPAMIARVGQETDALTNRFRIFMDTALIRLASEVLPYVNQKFEQFTNFVAANGDTIAKWINGAVNFFVNGAEQVFNFFSRNGAAITTAAQSAFSWIVNDLPPMLMRGGASVLRVFASFLDGVGGFAEGLIEHLPAILGTLDIVLNGIRVFTANAVGIVARLLNYQPTGTPGASNAASGASPGWAKNLPGVLSQRETPWGADPFGTGGADAGTIQANPLPAILRFAPRAVQIGRDAMPFIRNAGQAARNAGPLARGIAWRTGQGVGFVARNWKPIATVGTGYYLYNKAQEGLEGLMGPGGMSARDSFLGMVPQSNLAAQASNLAQLMRAGIDRGRGVTNTARAYADSLEANATKWPDTLKDALKANDEHTALLKQLVINTGKSADNSNPRNLLMIWHQLAGALIRDQLGAQAEQNYLDLTRT